MASFKFGQIEAAYIDFYKQNQATDIFKIDVNRSCFLMECHAIMRKTGGTL